MKKLWDVIVRMCPENLQLWQKKIKTGHAQSHNLCCSQDGSLNFMSCILHGTTSDSKEPDSLREERGEYKHFVYVNYNCLKSSFLELLNDFAFHHTAVVCYLFSARYSWHLDVLTL